jgi:hypothetical protein
MEGEETTLKVARKGLVLPVTMGTIRTIIAAGNVSKWDILPVDTEESTPPLYLLGIQRRFSVSIPAQAMLAGGEASRI